MATRVTEQQVAIVGGLFLAGYAIWRGRKVSWDRWAKGSAVLGGCLLLSGLFPKTQQ